MRTRLLLLAILIITQQLTAQQSSTISSYGKVFTIESPDLLLQKDKIYKVVFDVFTDGKKKHKQNASIVTVARYIQMHNQQGVPLENLKIALVLHGKATKNALNDKTYLKKYGTENPNSPLLLALKQANVDIFVCGQSLYAKGHTKENASNSVSVSLSALTALVHFQTEGYYQINFN